MLPFGAINDDDSSLLFDSRAVELEMEQERKIQMLVGYASHHILLDLSLGIFATSYNGIRARLCSNAMGIPGQAASLRQRGSIVNVTKLYFIQY